LSQIADIRLYDMLYAVASGRRKRQRGHREHAS